MTGMGYNSNATNNADHYVTGIALPFAFPFYDGIYESITMSSCGTVYFEDRGFGWASRDLPTDYTAQGWGPNTFIAHYLDRVRITPGAVYTKAEPENGRFIIEYHRVSGTFSDTATWQVVLYANGNIRMNYHTMLPWFRGTTGQVGIQRDTLTALQFLRWQPVLENRMSLLFRHPDAPEPDWLRLAPFEGVAPGGGFTSVPLSLSTEGLGVGLHTGRILLRSNDPSRPVVEIPVALTVTRPQPAAPRMAVNAPVIVDEGGEVAPDSARWLAVGPSGNPAALLYEITRAPFHGHFIHTDHPGTGILAFTQADLEDGAILYRHGGGPLPADSFEFRLTDGAATSPIQTAHIRVVPFNSPPTIALPDEWIAAHGKANHLVIHIDDPDAPIIPLVNVFDLDLRVGHGTLHLRTDVSGGFGSAHNNGTGNPTVSTRLEYIKATLANPTGLRYTPDPGFTGTDTLTVTVHDNGYSGYGEPHTTVVSIPIHVYDSPGEAWRHRHFGPPATRDPAAEATLWGWLADANRDGLANLLAYAFARDPWAAHAERPVRHAYDGIHFQIEFPLRHEDADLLWSAQVSTDLQTWTDEGIDYHQTGETPDHRLIRARVPFIDAGEIFLRLAVEREY